MDTLLPVIIGGAIGFLSAQVSLVFQFWRDRQSHKQQLERDEREHERQLERHRLEHERSQADEHKDQIRAAYATLLEALLVFYNVILSTDGYMKLRAGQPDKLVPIPEMKQETVHQSTLLRDALVKLDKATVTLMLLEPGVEIISEALRLALEDYVLLIENPLEISLPKTDQAKQRLEDSFSTILQQVRALRQTLPERLAKLR